MTSSIISRRQILRAGMAGVALATVGGCSDGSGGSDDSTTAATTLTIPVSSSPWLNGFKAVVNQYQGDHGVSIKLNEYPLDGLRTAEATAIQGGNNPFDLFLILEAWAGQFYSRGWVQPIANADPNFQPDKNLLSFDNLANWDSSSGTFSSNGNLMGIPYQGNMEIFIYRKDIYAKLGLAVPKTWDDVIANARKGMASGLAKYGMVIRGQGTAGGTGNSLDFLTILQTYGANYYTQGRTEGVNNPKGIKAAETFKALTQLGPSTPQSIGQNEVLAALQSGAAMQGTGTASIAPGLEDRSKSLVAGKLGYAILPAGDQGKPAVTEAVFTFAIPAGLKKSRALAAAKFLNYIQGSQAQEIFYKNGGIPTNRAVYDNHKKDGAAYIIANGQSLDYAVASVRVPWSAAMLPPVEVIIENMVAGKLTPTQAMSDMAEVLTQAAKSQ